MPSPRIVCIIQSSKRTRVYTTFLVAFSILLVNLHLRLLSGSQQGDPRTLRIAGRWKSIHKSYGLSTLPDHITVLPPSPPRNSTRFDRHKRHPSILIEQFSTPPQLHFETDTAEDAQPSVTLEDIARSFRAVALSEKAMAGEANRFRHGVGMGRQVGRGSSWTVVQAKGV
jgi:hypothetical protein